MKRILITGASGFIGSTLTEQALAKGYEVVAGIRTTSSRRFLQDERIRFLEMDFSKKQSLKCQLLEFAESHGKFDYIVHNAGITKARDARQFTLVNSDYTRNFAESLAETSLVPNKFIYISSLAAYGPGTGSRPVSPLQVPRPVSAYGQSKLSAEKFLASMVYFPYVVVRPTTVYGPKEKNVFIALKMLKRNMEVYLSNRKQLSSFIHVSDLCGLIFLAMESPYVRRSYFASDGNNYHTEDFMKTGKQILNKKTLILNIPVSVLNSIAFITRAVGKVTGAASIMNRDRIREFVAPNWSVQDDGLKKELGFLPGFNLETGLRQTIGWYQRHGWL